MMLFFSGDAFTCSLLWQDLKRNMKIIIKNDQENRCDLNDKVLKLILKYNF